MSETPVDRTAGPIGDILLTALRRYPDRVALVAGDDRVTYDEAERTIARLVALLTDEGLVPGDSVVQVGRNRPIQWLVTAACYVGGFRSASLPFDGVDPEVLRDRLAEARPRAVVADVGATEVLGTIRADGDGVAWWCDAPASGWRDLTADAAARDESKVHVVAPGDTVVRLAYTSGTTTGRPRGVRLSSSALAAVATITLAQIDWPTAPRVLCPEAIGGGFGNMVVPTLSRGGTFIMLDGLDLPALAETVREWSPSVLMMMPPALRALLAHPRTSTIDWSGIELVGYSGAVLDDAEIETAHAMFGPVLCGIFGQVEAPKTIALLAPADHVSPAVDLRRNLGRPSPGMIVQVQDRHGREVAPGVAGELCVRGATVMEGYLDDRHDAAAFRDGWLRTGDVCRFDASGLLHHVDRVMDVVQVGEELLCPSDLDEAITGGGHGPAATVVLEGGSVAVFLGTGADEDGVMGVLREAAVDLVGSITVPMIPVGFMGRVDRAALRQLWSARSVVQA